MTKGEVIAAELLPATGYTRRPYAPGSGVDAGTWNAAQNRYEIAPVNEQVVFTANDQWSALVLLQNAGTLTFSARTFAPADVNVSLNRITIANHGFASATEVVVTQDTTLMGGLAANTSYFVQSIDTNTIALHPTSALSGAMDITTTGAGNGAVKVATGRLVWFENAVGVQSVGAGGVAALRVQGSEMNVGDISGT